MTKQYLYKNYVIAQIDNHCAFAAWGIFNQYPVQIPIGNYRTISAAKYYIDSIKS